MPKLLQVLSTPSFGWLRVALFFCLYVLLLAGASRLPGSTAGMVLLFTLASFGLTWVFRKLIDKKDFHSLGWGFQGAATYALMGLLVAVAMLGTGTGLLAVLDQLTWLDYQFSARDFFLSLLMMVLVGFYEELVFRGYILGNLMEAMRPPIALLVSAAIFAILHGANPNAGWLPLVNIFLAGLLLGINYIHTRNLWFGITLHIAWNFLQGPVLGFEVSGLALPSVLTQQTGNNHLLTGGDFGFEGSLVNTILCACTTLALAFSFKRFNRNVSAQD